MLNNFTGADKVYLVCGYTDLRRGIDGLAGMVQQQFRLDPFTNTLFLFFGRKQDRIKGLYWEKDGFVLVHLQRSREKLRWRYFYVCAFGTYSKNGQIHLHPIVIFVAFL